MVKFGFLKYLSGYRAGDWVEVKSAKEILATLDDKGRLDHLPFMPEMLQFCGKRFLVSKSAHKSCDTISDWKTIRGQANAVHLEGLRCDGGAHGGCQAGCLLFWKDTWLKRVNGKNSDSGSVNVPLNPGEGHSGCELEVLTRATCSTEIPTDPAVEKRYFCQATELPQATTPISWWDPRPYLVDILSGNVRIDAFIRYVAIAAFNVAMRFYSRGRPYPYVHGQAQGKTPVELLNLQPGEMVRVRSKEEIMQTINEGSRNRGLWFDVEMVPFCGKTFRVLRRVERIINEKTGRLISLPNDCLILEGVECSGCFSRYRLFCPRRIYPYWREIWLRRTDEVKRKPEPYRLNDIA